MLGPKIRYGYQAYSPSDQELLWILFGFYTIGGWIASNVRFSVEHYSSVELFHCATLEGARGGWDGPMIIISNRPFRMVGHEIYG